MRLIIFLAALVAAVGVTAASGKNAKKDEFVIS